MDAADVVCEEFDRILALFRTGAREADLTEPDRTVWYVVATRCEIDINGFNSVFEQMLTEAELLYLVGALDRLGEPTVAAAFRRAHAALRRAGFYETPGAFCGDFGPELVAELDEIDTALSSNAAMWDLDRKLAALVARPAGPG